MKTILVVMKAASAFVWSSLSPRLVIAILALVGLISPGCSIMGYATGRSVDASRRQTVPINQVERLRAHQLVWLMLQNGETIAGSLGSNRSPDSLSVECLSRRATTDPFGIRERRIVARDSISRVQVPANSCRWLGLAVGATADLTLVYLAASIDHSFHTDPVRTPVGPP